MLQVPRVGGNPDRRAVGLGPQARRRDIAQRLADAGPGLGQHEARRAVLIARGEGLGHGRGVIRLAGSWFGILAQQVGQPVARIGGMDRLVARRRRGRFLLPFRQAAPDLQPAPGRRRGLVDARPHGGQHEMPPGPAARRHGPGDGDRLRLGADGGQPLQQRLRHGPKRDGLGLMVVGNRQPQRGGQPARRRHAEPPGMDEGEQLQQIQRREGIDIQPPRHGRHMAQQRRRPPAHAPRDRIQPQPVNLPVPIQPHCPGRPGDKGRRVGQKDVANRFHGGRL